MPLQFAIIFLTILGNLGKSKAAYACTQLSPPCTSVKKYQFVIAADVGKFNCVGCQPLANRVYRFAHVLSLTPIQM
jgi:hypothetical protein